MLGNRLELITDGKQTVSAAGATIMSLRDVGVVQRDGVHRLQNVDIDIRSGEIVGVAAWRVAQCTFSAFLPGDTSRLKALQQFPHTLASFPKTGYTMRLLQAFLYENVALLEIGKRRGRMPWRYLRKETAALLTSFDVRAPDVNVPVQNLSGGNQQKLVLARELNDNPPALVAENPTRGLDIQSAAAIHQRLRDARENGCAIVFYSSDIEELVSLADRVVVVREGRLEPVARDVDAIGSALLGTSTSPTGFAG